MTSREPASEWTFPITPGNRTFIEEAVRLVYVRACGAVGSDVQSFVESDRYMALRWSM